MQVFNDAIKIEKYVEKSLKKVKDALKKVMGVTEDDKKKAKKKKAKKKKKDKKDKKKKKESEVEALGNQMAVIIL